MPKIEPLRCLTYARADLMIFMTRESFGKTLLYVVVGYFLRQKKQNMLHQCRRSRLCEHREWCGKWKTKEVIYQHKWIIRVMIAKRQFGFIQSANTSHKVIVLCERLLDATWISKRKMFVKIELFIYLLLVEVIGVYMCKVLKLF